MSNVTVNFAINANASGTIDVFGQTPEVMTNFLIPSVTLPASLLYTDANNAVFKFSGVSSNINDMTGYVVPSYSNFTNSGINNGVNAIINGGFNCSNAKPYNDAKYTNVYNSQTNFGYVALGAYAHSLFGHVAATAAIDNDIGFVANMVGNTLANPDHAKIAAILTSNLGAMDVSAATAVVKQVIGQDATRAKDVDNDGVTPNSNAQTLQFKPNDVIYMTVTLTPPKVTVSNPSQAGSNVFATAAAGINGTDYKYPLKITLS